MKTVTMFRIVLTGLFCLMIGRTVYSQKVAPSKLPKIEFDYPDDIADTAKKNFEKKFRQGHSIYVMTCASCHNKTVNGKSVIPDFSLPQLMDYEMRMAPEHGEQLTDRFITDEEMQRVIIFLRYKKRSGVLVRPGPVLDQNKRP
jgi:cytochrome c553